MKIVITGGLGHIGSALIRALPGHFEQPEIVILDDLSTERQCSMFHLPPGARYTLIELDITRTDITPHLDGVDVLVHLAAITDAASSFNRAARVEEVNLGGLQRVATACQARRVPMIFISTTSVYGSQASLVDENCAELLPQSPYADTKLRGEWFLLNDPSVRDLAMIIFRFGTICGVSEGMRFHTAVNKFCWQACLGQPISVWRTAMHQKRPYLDLPDAIAGIVFAIQRKVFDRRVYNMVTANRSVAQIVDLIQRHISTLQVNFVENALMNQLSYEVAAERIKAVGFAFHGSIEASIEQTLRLLGGIGRRPEDQGR